MCVKAYLYILLQLLLLPHAPRNNLPEIGRVLHDRVVGQVRVFFVEVADFVLLGPEPDIALVEVPDRERLHVGDQNSLSEVEFELFDDQGSFYVFLDDPLDPGPDHVFQDRGEVVEKVDSAAAGH